MYLISLESSRPLASSPTISTSLCPCPEPSCPSWPLNLGWVSYLGPTLTPGQLSDLLSCPVIGLFAYFRASQNLPLHWISISMRTCHFLHLIKQHSWPRFPWTSTLSLSICKNKNSPRKRCLCSLVTAFPAPRTPPEQTRPGLSKSSQRRTEIPGSAHLGQMLLLWSPSQGHRHFHVAKSSGQLSVSLLPGMLVWPFLPLKLGRLGDTHIQNFISLKSNADPQ